MARTKASLRGHPGKEVASEQRRMAEWGMFHLRQALKCFKASDNQQTAKRVRLAISSAYGALRICRHRGIRDDVAGVIRREELDKKFQWAKPEVQSEMPPAPDDFRAGGKRPGELAAITARVGVGKTKLKKNPSKKGSHY